MATRKCPNGHYYDSSIYGNNCPFCPSAGRSTKMNEGSSYATEHTHVQGEDGKTTATNGGGEQPTVNINPGSSAGDYQHEGRATVIRHASPSGVTNLSTGGGKRLVGLLVSYYTNPHGEVYKVYEGRNFIGRAATCDIPVPNDNSMSGQHLMILYREAEGVFWAADQNSSNGTFVNGTFVSDRIKIKTGDVIVAGATKFLFFAIPRF